MRLKSYFASSVAEAIEKARVELGSEAMLLNSREIAPEQRHLGAYEVVFGITGEPLLPRRTEAVAHLFTPPAVEEPVAQPKAKAAAASESPRIQAAGRDANRFEPARFQPARFEPPVFEDVPEPSLPDSARLNAAPAPEPIAAVPAWKRTLEELVARQADPVPVAVLPKPKKPANADTALPAKPVETERPVRPRAAAASAPSPAIAVASNASPEMLADELVSLRQQIERVKNSLVVSHAQPTPAGRPRELDLLQAQLSSLGFSPAFSRKISDSAVERLAAFSKESASLSFLNRSGYSLEHLQQVTVAELQSRLQIRPEIGVAGAGQRVMMLVGPPGAGKTTTLVKLAVKYGLERRLPVHLLSLDTVRVGGSEQLGAFARILNVAFDALHTPAALGEALADCRTDEVIFIDCPGYAPADMEEAASTAAFLRRNPFVDVQLVLPAFMNSSSLTAAAQRFASFSPSKLLFTHLDEVDSLGAILEHSIQSDLPVSFLTNGQGIPQDLQEATKDRFTQGILNGAAAFGAA